MKPTQLQRDLYCLQCAGFLMIPDVVGGAALDAIRRDVMGFEDEVERFVRDGGRAILRHAWPLLTTRAVYAVSREIQDLVMSPMVQYIANGYLGRAVLRDCLMQTNMPDPRNAARGVSAEVSYHRDTKWADGEEVRPMYMHAFLLLTEFTRENGATLIVPGTHRTREPGYYFKDSDPRGKADGIDYRVYERRYFPTAVCLEGGPGTLIFLDPMAIHTQGINVTPVRRSAVNMTFRAHHIVSQPSLLNACAIADRHARVPIRADFREILENDPALPAAFGPLGNEWPRPALVPGDAPLLESRTE